ncbi:hypothetical protein KIPB_003443 [Kipferlia bialata]|uniref:Tyrosine-protein kinase ephrin type A/B receptor-like domain-containing protein n=1 Tax=Kipferlia bialata TaxID=797122 RepID=A0A9K3CTN9_9EUKA|nr:hypothetical protein KIPB_003443 [Kipferlia bialata]|eukprot:g3443.t1
MLRVCIVALLVSFALCADYTYNDEYSGTITNIGYNNNQSDNYIVNVPYAASATVKCTGEVEGVLGDDEVWLVRAFCDENNVTSNHDILEKESGSISIDESFAYDDTHNCFFVDFHTDSSETDYPGFSCEYVVTREAVTYPALTAASGSFGNDVYVDNQHDTFIIHPASIASVSARFTGATEPVNDTIKVKDTAHVSHQELQFSGVENCFVVQFDTNESDHDYPGFTCNYTTTGLTCPSGEYLNATGYCESCPSGKVCTGDNTFEDCSEDMIPNDTQTQCIWRTPDKTTVLTDLTGTFSPETYYNDQYEMFLVHPLNMSSVSITCTGVTEPDADRVKASYALSSGSEVSSMTTPFVSASGAVNFTAELPSFPPVGSVIYENSIAVTFTTDADGDNYEGFSCDYTATCAVGQYYLSGECRACPTGEICPGNSESYECPSHQAANPTQTECVDVLCYGRDYATNHECVECPTGTIPSNDRLECDDILCLSDWYLEGNECAECEGGLLPFWTTVPNADESGCVEPMTTWLVLGGGAAVVVALLCVCCCCCCKDKKAPVSLPTQHTSPLQYVRHTQ